MPLNLSSEKFAADFVPFRSLLFSLLILLAGCATPERVAQIIITAPNLQKSQPPPHWADKWLSAFSGGTNRFEKMTISVGPPEARLEAIDLAPGDYHLRFASSLENKSKGKRVFEVKAFLQTNCPIDCLKEQGTIFVLHGYSIQ